MAVIFFFIYSISNLQLISAVAGFLGSSVAALLSINERVSYGWVFSSGSRIPDSAIVKERFNLRLIRGFIVRPFVGVVGGLFMLFGCLSGVLWEISIEETYKITFWSLLSGFFAKTLFDKLKEVFKNFIGK